MSMLAWAVMQVAVAATVGPCPTPCRTPERCIVIDPGHPSEVNSGAQSINGVAERDVNWAVARELERRLTELGLEALLTRSDSLQMMTNIARAQFANCAAPALFLRLHADAAPARGFAVFVADREGRAQGVVGPPLPVRRQSAAWAQALEREMAAALAPHGIPSRGVRPDIQTAVGARQGALTGSIMSRVPTVLVEMVVLTDRRDAQFIKSASGRQAMADALARGVLSQLPPRPSR